MIFYYLILGAYVLSPVQVAICVTLIVKAIRWTRSHPFGADPGDRFLGLQVWALVTGLVLGSLLLSTLPPPTVAGLFRGDTDAPIVLGLDLLVSLYLVPAIGLIRPVRKKANLVALLASVGILPGVGVPVYCYFLAMALKNF